MFRNNEDSVREKKQLEEIGKGKKAPYVPTADNAKLFE